MSIEQENRAMMVTTIRIPIWLRREIRQKGLTCSGAMMRGMRLMDSRENIDDLIKERVEMRANITTYQRAYADAIKRISVLEEKNK